MTSKGGENGRKYTYKMPVEDSIAELKQKLFISGLG